MKSLNRSSDALLTYSEESGSPVFSIATSLMLSNVTVKSGAKGQVSTWTRRKDKSFMGASSKTKSNFVA